MHTQSLDRVAKEILHSLPIDVEFVGLRGNTMSLANAGWELSMCQEWSHYGEHVLQLAMRHSGARLYALSSPTLIADHGQLYEAMQSPVNYAKMLAQHSFRIQHIAPEIRLVTHSYAGEAGRSFLRDEFHPIDPRPQERVTEEHISEFKFFKPFNPELKDIIVAPSQVPELLELILKAQGPGQREIRERERSRDNLAAYRSDGVRPAHQVQAQIITLAGAA